MGRAKWVHETQCVPNDDRPDDDNIDTKIMEAVLTRMPAAAEEGADAGAGGAGDGKK
jgi:hypothetical protein